MTHTENFGSPVVCPYDKCGVKTLTMNDYLSHLDSHKKPAVCEWKKSQFDKKVEILWHEKDKILHAELLRVGSVSNAEYSYKLNYSKKWIQRTRT